MCNDYTDAWYMFYLLVTNLIETYLISAISHQSFLYVVLLMLADNGYPIGSSSSVGSSFPFIEMPQCIPFDEKNTKTWK